LYRAPAAALQISNLSIGLPMDHPDFDAFDFMYTEV
jgi:hypothetical protein